MTQIGIYLAGSLLYFQIIQILKKVLQQIISL